MDIEKIISRLERIDHKEYSGGFEFADSSTFDEMCRCYEERKVLAQEIERLNNIINELEKWLSEEKNYYLENYYYSNFNAYATYIDVILDKLDKLKELKEKK